MIQIDKVRAAFAGCEQSLCSQAWTHVDDNDAGVKMCAISTLVSFAGVQPELMRKMHVHSGWALNIASFCAPIVRAEYGITKQQMDRIINIFDGNPDNLYQGIVDVIDFCEQENKAAPTEGLSATLGDWNSMATYGTSGNNVATYGGTGYVKKAVGNHEYYQQLQQAYYSYATEKAAPGLFSLTSELVLLPKPSDYIVLSAAPAPQVLLMGGGAP